MAESKAKTNDEFWLFHDLEKDEIVELRKFIDPDLNLRSIEGFDKLLHKLNHLLD